MADTHGKASARGRDGWARRISVRRAALVAALVGVAVVSALAGTLIYYARGLPEVPSVADYRPPQLTRVLDRNDRLIDELFVERRTVVPMERVPRVLVLSVLAAEDADFYRHEGLDYLGIVRAVIRNLVSDRAPQGASTITQQIVKNLLLTPERTYARKIRELLLARRLEQKLSKDDILFLYLNHIYFGHGRYGVAEAARYYFGCAVDELTLAQASLIAGLPQAPGRLSPLKHPAAARKRQLYVLEQLERKRAEYWPDLSPEQIRQARAHPVELSRPVPARTETAPEIMSMVRSELQRVLGREETGPGGYTVRTTIDLELQREARAALLRGLTALDKRQRWRAPFAAKKSRKARVKSKGSGELRAGASYDARVTGADDEEGRLLLEAGGHAAYADLAQHGRYNPGGLRASAFADIGALLRVSPLPAAGSAQQDAAVPVRLQLGPEGAAIVVDPRTRGVLALVGGSEASYGFNRAVQALRQPGSTFKPIVYAVALRSGRYTPASLVVDAPEVYDQWRPRNHETWSYRGAVRLRDALARSINLVAVRVMSEVTPAAVVQFAGELGIRSELEPTIALALGASAVRPLELTNAYATFAAGGRWQPVRLIRSVNDASGAPVTLPAPPAARSVMSAAEAYLVTSMLTSVVQDGTGAAAKRLGRPVAGKTGTSNDARDAWFIGYTPSIVAGVWVGFDDNRPLGRREGGARSALPIWLDIMKAAAKGPVVGFPVPAGITTARIDPQSGLLAYAGMKNAIDEVFLAGTVPAQTARRPDVVDANTFIMEQFRSVP
ncbi:MAG: PBP1A family penicillin-binding protein [Proteobacteria bacterium]|nr:PBP1A family penicillin-binding protein [Pseudomonadota bacterium]